MTQTKERPREAQTREGARQINQGQYTTTEGKAQATAPMQQATHGRWKRCRSSVHWYCNELPGWCITSAWKQDRRGVYHRQYCAMRYGQELHEAQRSSSPVAVIDEVEQLIKEGYR